MERKFILCNAFSLQMFNGSKRIDFEEINQNYAKSLMHNHDVVSAIGHQDTANVLSNIFDKEIIMNRTNVSIDSNTTLIIAQLVGGRLPEGSTTLPEGFKFKFYKVETIENWWLESCYEDGGDMTCVSFIGTYTEAFNASYNLLPYNGMEVKASVKIKED